MKFTYSSGQRPLDGYTLKRGVGRGGFGEVYYGVSDGGKEVALKLGARYGSGGWYAPPGVDLSAFGERGWLL